MLKVNWLGKQGVEVVTQLIGIEATSFGCDWRPVTLCWNVKERRHAGPVLLTHSYNFDVIPLEVE